MPRTGQEVVLEGWLTKSPPIKRLWRARWRRRWFLLHNSGEIPGQYVLTYYTDRKCRKLKGTINLDQCEQVDTGMKFEDSKYKFEYMFDIKTPSRIYYLAADSEEEMKAWANCICDICGLKATPDDEVVPPPSNIYQNDENFRNLHNERAKDNTESPPVSPVSSSGPYIPISECITGLSPTQGVQDFYDLIQHNMKNSYFRTYPAKAHNNETYDTATPTYLNDLNAPNDPRSYDFPRKLQPPPNNIHKSQKNIDMYCNLPKVEEKRGINGSPLQSPTDSESVFSDDDWPQNSSLDSTTKSVNASINSANESQISDQMNKLTLEDLPKMADPPPRPPKPQTVTPSYFNLSQVPTKTDKQTNSKQTDDATNTLTKNNKQPLTDDMYDFPRSHQIDSNDTVSNTLIRRHCYNNAAPIKVEGEIFRYDISPKPSTSSNDTYSHETNDTLEEPSSPVSQASGGTSYSNLPSPVLLSDAQLMPPPQIYRSLKPKRKLSDSLSITSSNEPSSPRLAPTVDRSCKPLITPPQSSTGLRKAFDSDSEFVRKNKNLPSPTLDSVYGNHQMFEEEIISARRGGGDLSRVQYLDLDHSQSEVSSTSNATKVQPLRSPGASTVYKKVDFMKTEAFFMIRQHLEKQRKEPVTYKK